MSGDDLTIALFVFGTAIAFGLTAVTLAGWTNRALVVSLFSVAAILFVCSIFWPTIGENLVGLKWFLQALIANYFGFRAIGLVIFLMFCFDFAIEMGWISINRDSAPAPATDAKPKKVFVNVSPSYLIGLYENRTTIQGDDLAAAYISKWMIVTGRVQDIRLKEDGTCHALIQDSDGAWTGADFTEKSSDTISHIAHNSIIKVRGEISSVKPWVILRKFELDEIL
jgi:hypothetical protein